MECFELLEGLDECEDVSNLDLVEKILAPKILNKTTVSNILMGVLKTRAKVLISPWNNNMFFFQFGKAEDRREVLMEAAWSVMGNLLVLQPL
ncbi:hypothetical protein LOK49_LG01G02339 [Camellia lanceoleosa]|uniref:Uncharacterized protein n=1 Tax=Camellia lanceoleosa TaxID=1840588 RepID=A0ACC0J2K0_9ERIC|nr:hypothetical protein LOK49_LG01G02339 [Camellia lanceoleosa]